MDPCSTLFSFSIVLKVVIIRFTNLCRYDINVVNMADIKFMFFSWLRPVIIDGEIMFK